jgi:hypothetical protein
MGINKYTVRMAKVKEDPGMGGSPYHVKGGI